MSCVTLVTRDAGHRITGNEQSDGGVIRWTGNHVSLHVMTIHAIKSRAPAAILFGLLTAAAPAAADIDPVALYGGDLQFDVLRNGDVVGEHNVQFALSGRDLTVDARFELEIRILFFPAYRYAYQSTSVWRDGRLVRLDALTDDDGSVSEVAARAEDGRVRIRGRDGTEWGDPSLIPTDHWNADVLGSDTVLNTITGEVSRVSIRDMGEETLPTATGTCQARRYAYSGDLETEVWYDPDGRWVGMRFQGKDGSTIDYRCRRCGPVCGEG